MALRFVYKIELAVHAARIPLYTSKVKFPIREYFVDVFILTETVWIENDPNAEQQSTKTENVNRNKTWCQHVKN